MSDEHTIRTRLLALMKRSRQAVRLYGSVKNVKGDSNSEYSEAQATEWKNINGELLRLVGAALDEPSTHKIVLDACSIYERFTQIARTAEVELQEKQARLILGAQNGDYVRTAMLSAELVVLKARLQAAQAACHELGDVMKRSRVALPPIELGQQALLEEKSAANDAHKGGPQKLAKVIPMKRREAAS